MRHVYAGSYTRKGGSKGIYLFDFDERSGAIALRATYGECESPAYLDAGGGYLYAIEERFADVTVCTYAREETTGELRFAHRAHLPGNGICHVRLWPDARHLSAANYMSGSAVVCALGADGSVSGVTDIAKHEGVGFLRDTRQESAHVHSTGLSPDGRFLLAADLGLDFVACYPADMEAGKLGKERARFTAPKGSGPRHFAFSPDGRYLYVLAEIGSLLLVYDFLDARGETRPILQRSTLPAGFAGESIAADIHFSPDGRFVYASNRGHDSLACFAVEEGGAAATLTGIYPAGGSSPRGFCLSPDGRFVLTANEESGNVAVCPRDDTTGAVGASVSEARVPQASFVAVW